MTPTLDRHITLDPARRGGRPTLAGTRITVADLVVMHLLIGLSLVEIAAKYDLSLPAVYSAMAYYYDHRDEIDRSIGEDEAFQEAFARDNPSLLRQRLAELRRH